MNVTTSNNELIRSLVLDIKSHVRGMWRYRWPAMAVAWIGCVVGWLVIYSMPNIYEAKARIYVDTESVIKPLLEGIAISSDVMNEVNVVTREMLSRPNLASVARQTDLDLRAQSELQFEELVTALQDRIVVQGNRDKIFSISFEHPDRGKAIAVVQSLVDTFVERSLGGDRSDSNKAQDFLQAQIDEYERRLTEAEDRLAEFKRKNFALMPDQTGDYFARLQSAQGILHATESKLSLASERRAELLRQLEGEEPVFGIMPAPDGDAGNSAGSTATKIRELELQLETLRLQYTDRHPRIGQILETIELLRAQQAEERAAVQPGAGAGPMSTNPLDINPVYQNMRIQLSQVEVEIASLRAERNQQRSEVQRLTQLVDTIPQVEAELNRLNRDYDVVKAKHDQLLQQLETANIGENVNSTIDEVQFRIIDPTYSAITPVAPNRPVFLTGILILTIAAGGGLAYILNQLNPTFFGHRDVTQVTGLPVLASISLLLSPEEVGAEKSRRSVLASSFAALLICFGIVVMFADAGSSLVRSISAGL